MVAQLLLNILVTSSTVLVVAVGFALIFGTVRFFHFAHGAVFTLGAYLTYEFHVNAGLPLGLAFLLCVVVSAGVGCGLDVVVYRPLRRKQSPPAVLLLASLGLYVLLQNTISLLFGDATKIIRGTMPTESLEVFGARVTPAQLTIIAASITLVSLTHLLITKTRFGKAIRATANDVELAKLSGIDTDRVVLGVFALGSALAGAAGTLVALDVDMTPTMGMNSLMMAVVAIVIGGLGSIPAAALGALLLGIAQHLGVWQLGSQWQDAIAFIILLVFLFARPEGFLGQKSKKATV
jgi:branched-chain amino acid transport system permease protein